MKTYQINGIEFQSKDLTNIKNRKKAWEFIAIISQLTVKYKNIVNAFFEYVYPENVEGEIIYEEIPIRYKNIFTCCLEGDISNINYENYLELESVAMSVVTDFFTESKFFARNLTN